MLQHCFQKCFHMFHFSVDPLRLKLLIRNDKTELYMKTELRNGASLLVCHTEHCCQSMCFSGLWLAGLCTQQRSLRLQSRRLYFSTPNWVLASNSIHSSSSSFTSSIHNTHSPLPNHTHTHWDLLVVYRTTTTTEHSDWLRVLVETHMLCFNVVSLQLLWNMMIILLFSFWRSLVSCDLWGNMSFQASKKRTKVKIFSLMWISFGSQLVTNNQDLIQDQSQSYVEVCVPIE